MKKIIIICLILTSCKKEDIDTKNSVSLKEDTLQKTKDSVIGYPCADTTNYDVFNGVRFVNNNTYGNKPYGALIVNKKDGYPVYDGNESSRFELKTGDCGGEMGYDDCSTNRSRSEIREDWVNPSTVLDKTITYTENVFIPSQYHFKPTKDGLLVLSQVHWDGGDGTVGALTYLVMEQNNTLLIRTHKGFSWDWNQNYTITTSPYDKWINIKYEVKVSNNSDGYIKVFVDGKLLFIESRPTVNNPTTCSIQLKLGIYNTFINNNLPTQYYDQIFYIDGVSKKIN